MDITHTGSSMKWRASLLVLQNQVKLELNAFCDKSITVQFASQTQHRDPPQRTSALTSSSLCNIS